MNGIRARKLCLVAVFAVMGATAASASAAPPEFQVGNKKTGVIEPLKRPVAFTQSGSGATLRSDSGVELVCSSSSGKGKLTGPKTMTVKTTYTGCETAAATKCQSGRTPGEIKSAKLTGALVYALKGTLIVPAIELGPASGTSILKYTCAGKQKIVVSGHVLGAVGPLEESTSELTETFAEGEEPEPGCGKQEIQLIEGLGSCQHLELEPEPSANKKPVVVKETSKKEFTGHVSLLK
jgi:hypothetical protein